LFSTLALAGGDGLQQKSIEALMALHLDESAKVDRQALDLILRERLNEEPTGRLLQLRHEAIPPESMWVSRECPSLVEGINENTLIVHGKVVAFEFDREQLIDHILRRAADGTDAWITVEVIDHHPAEPAYASITFRDFNFGAVGQYLPVGAECFFKIKNGREGPYCGPYDTFSVCENKVNMGIGYGQLDLPDAWDLIRSIYDLEVLGALEPELLERWQSAFEHDDIVEARQALRVLSIRPETTPAPDHLLALLKRHYPQPQTADCPPPDHRDYLSLAASVIEAHSSSNTPDALQQLIDFFLADFRERARPVFSEETGAALMKTVANSCAAERTEWMESLLREPEKCPAQPCGGICRFPVRKHQAIEALAEVPGDDIDMLLLRMAHTPSEFGLSALELGSLWRSLAKRGVSEIRPLLETFLDEPAGVDTGVPLRRANSTDLRKSAQEALMIFFAHSPDQGGVERLVSFADSGNKSALRYLLDRDDVDRKLLLKLLHKADLNYFASHLIPGHLADPSFLSKIREALKTDRSGVLLSALAACGEVEEAIDMATEILNAPVPRDIVELNQVERGAAASLLAYHGVGHAVRGLKRLLQPRTISELRDLADKQDSQSNPRIRYYPINRWRDLLLAALVRQSPRAAVPVLREYLNDYDPDCRLLSAWALLALGHDDGEPTVNAYANRERRYDGSVSLLLFRSEKTDALLLKRFDGGLLDDDTELFDQRPWYARRAAMDFVTDHKEQVLPILLKHLDSADRRSAAEAGRLVEWLVAPEWEYYPEKLVPAERQRRLQELMAQMLVAAASGS
jgi:hypothetical protein